MTEAEYRKLLRDYRKAQLTITRESVDKVAAAYKAAAKSMAARVAATAAGSLSQTVALMLLDNLNQEMDALRGQTTLRLNEGMTAAAQSAVERESALEALVHGAADTIQFGNVAREAVDAVAAHVYGDGLNLFDRLHELDADVRRAVGDTLVQGVAEQVSAKKLGKRLEAALARAGVKNPLYRAVGIARTEIGNAHREAHIRSTMQPDGKPKEWVRGIGWRLSPSHKRPCLCEIYASDDGDGLGPGNYLPQNAPLTPHTRCLCYTVTLVVSLPDEQFVSKSPQPDDVSETTLRYYAETQGDPQAKRALEKRQSK